MAKFDFGSLKTKDKGHENITISPKTSIVQEKRSRISTEKLQQELNKLKKEVESLKQGGFKEKIDIPEEIYNGLWIMCRSFRSQYRNKSDTMLGQLNLVMNYFHVDLDNNPFDKLKRSE